jgi:hypothetical protein
MPWRLNVPIKPNWRLAACCKKPQEAAQHRSDLLHCDSANATPNIYYECVDLGNLQIEHTSWTVVVFDRAQEMTDCDSMS